MPVNACNSRRRHGCTNQRRMALSAVAHIAWHSNASPTWVAASPEYYSRESLAGMNVGTTDR